MRGARRCQRACPPDELVEHHSAPGRFYWRWRPALTPARCLDQRSRYSAPDVLVIPRSTGCRCRAMHGEHDHDCLRLSGDNVDGARIWTVDGAIGCNAAKLDKMSAVGYHGKPDYGVDADVLTGLVVERERIPIGVQVATCALGRHRDLDIPYGWRGGI